MKRNFLLASVITFCLALVLSLVAFNPVTAYADDEGASVAVTTIQKSHAYSYSMEYLAKEAGGEYDSDTTVTVEGVPFVKPSDDEGGTSSDAQAEKGFLTTDGKNIEFLRLGEFEIILSKEASGEGEEATAAYEYTFKVNSVNLKENAPELWKDLKYDYDQAALEEYNNKVGEATIVDGEKIAVDDDYVVPDVTELITDTYFDVDELEGTLYYAVPGSSYTSKSVSDLSSVKFEVSKIGTYKFYVLVENDFVEMTTEDLVEDIGGWYKKNDKGEAVGDVVVPVFTFNVVTSTKPKIEVGTSEYAYIGLKYTVKSFTIVASDYETDYTLYYSDKPLTQEQIGDDYTKATLESKGLKEVTLENKFSEANLFDADDKTFTPETKGYYYVVCHVKDFANEDDTVISAVIDATHELQQVKYEKQFFKYNWLSVVLLSVAVICFVAIILLLFVKPKENNANQTKK